MIGHILKLIWNKKGSNALMILEIFLSFLVLFSVLAYVLFNLERLNAPLGFETEDRWIVSLDNLHTLDSIDRITTLKNLESELLSLDEIESISFANNITPFNGSTWSTGNDENGFDFHCLIVPVDYNLAKTIDLKLTEGRWYNEEDKNATIEPMVMNKAFKDKYYPEKSMIDSILIISEEDHKFIGVVEAYRYKGEFEENYPTLFINEKFGENYDSVILKMKPGTTTAFEEKLSKVVNGTTKRTGNVIANLDKERKEDSQESWMMFIALLSVCGFLCINVALGLFGVLWYNINKRKSEIGLRQALGAHGVDITKQFILEIMILTMFGLIIGIFFAVQVPLLDLTEFEDSMFYKATGYASLIILTLVFICALFPSIQAAKITPANSLHED